MNATETPAADVAFDAEHQARFEWLLTRYPTRRAALLPTLRLIEDQWGDISLAGMRYAAELLELSPASVYGVVTFYTHYRRPGMGRYRVMACRTLPCALAGAAEIHRRLEAKLGITFGETSKDGTWSLEYVECLAACGQGPCVQINDDYHEHLTPEKIDEVIDELGKV